MLPSYHVINLFSLMAISEKRPKHLKLREVREMRNELSRARICCQRSKSELLHKKCGKLSEGGNLRELGMYVKIELLRMYKTILILIR